MMHQATAANEYAQNLGPLHTLADAEDPEYLEEAEDVDLMTTEQRQALNVYMAEYFNG